MGIAEYIDGIIDLLMAAGVSDAEIEENGTEQNPAHDDLGDRDEMYRWLEHGVETRAPFMYWLRTFPLLSHEWKDPRFARLLERMGLGAPLDPEAR